MKIRSNHIVLALLVFFSITNNWIDAYQSVTTFWEHEKVDAVDVSPPLDFNIEFIDSSDDEEGSGFFDYQNLDLQVYNFNYTFSNPNSSDSIVDLDYYILYCCLKLDCFIS